MLDNSTYMFKKREYVAEIIGVDESALAKGAMLLSSIIRTNQAPLTGILEDLGILFIRLVTSIEVS